MLLSRHIIIGIQGMFNNQGSLAYTNQPFCLSVQVALGRGRGRHVTNGNTWEAADSRNMKM
jgi:hypothetical protein